MEIARSSTVPSAFCAIAIEDRAELDGAVGLLRAPLAIEDRAELGLAMLSTLAKRLLAAARTRNN